MFLSQRLRLGTCGISGPLLAGRKRTLHLGVSSRFLRVHWVRGRNLLLAAALQSALTTRPAVALDPDRTLAQLQHTAWTIKDGAPSQVSALAQTSDGWLWIGSSVGLFRFDGIAFERYTPPAGTRLPSYNVYALAATPDSGLWVSFRPSGLGFIKGRSFTAYTRPEEIPGRDVFVLAADPDGRVWAGTPNGLAFRDSAGWHEAGSAWSIPRTRVTAIFADRAGSVWVADSAGIYCLARGQRQFQLVKTGLKFVYSLARSGDGRVWFANNEYSSLHPLDEAPGSRPLRISNYTAAVVLFDRDDCMWAVMSSAGIMRVRAHSAVGRRGSPGAPVIIEACTRSDGLSGQQARVALEDREGSIWVGTSGGVDRFRHNDLVAVPLPRGHLCMTLLPADSGGVWVCSALGPPAVLVQSGRTTVQGGLTNVGCYYRESRSVTWWGGSQGIWRQQGARVTHYPLPHEYQDKWIWELIPGDAPGSLWACIDDVGLVAFENGAFRNRVPPSLPGAWPSASWPAPDGRVWLGFNENKMCVLEHGAITNYTIQNGLDVGRVRVVRGRDKHVWVGGELGLDLFHDGRLSSVLTEDAPFGTVTGVVETATGDLWLNEMRGIIHVSRQEVARVLADRGHRVRYRRYDYLDGMPGGGQMNWTCSTAVQGTDGRLWFATDNGLVWIDPARSAIDAKPLPVAIRSVDTDAANYAASPGMRLPKGTSNLTFRYAAVTLADPERVHFRYQLEGLDPGWHDAGAQRAARFTRLKPGHYRFRVVAANADGIWSSARESLDFTITPRFYQTGWFRFLVAVAFAGLMWTLYATRLRQEAARLQRLHEERTDERMRIAHELHDTLLQGVLGVWMQLHSITRLVPPEMPAKGKLDGVLAQMRQVTDEARDAVSALRAQAEGPAADLDALLAQAASVFQAASSATFHVRVLGAPRPLRPRSCDEMFRVGKECLANAYRHADAHNVEVELRYQSGELLMIIRDDGRGIEPEIVTGGREGHWGLSGMRERAAGLGARFSMRSRVGGGTEVALSVPGRIAYAPRQSAGPFRRLTAWIGTRARPRRQGNEEP